MSGFWSLPLLMIVAILLVGMVAAYELGLRIHARLGGSARHQSSSDEGFILSGVLGLLALLMAFAFSMALNRYENRRELMVQEANAISSFDVTAGALPEPSSDQLRLQLRPYAQARLAASISDGDARKQALQAAAQRRETLEATVRQAMRDREGGPSAVAIANAYNALSDRAADRDALSFAHLPERVLALLAAYCLVSAAMLGYAVAADRGRHRVASTTLFLLLSLAFATVVDLDRPRSGAIMVSQEPLRQAVEGLG